MKGFNNASASQRFHKITERYEKNQAFARKQYSAALLI